MTLRHITVKFKNLKHKENYTKLSGEKRQSTHIGKTIKIDMGYQQQH